MGETSLLFTSVRLPGKYMTELLLIAMLQLHNNEAPKLKCFLK